MKKILSLTFALTAAAVRAQAQTPKPNILVIFGDDIGMTNISAYGLGVIGYRTPNIDRLAKEWALFTDYYGQQSCTAGRAADKHPDIVQDLESRLLVYARQQKPSEWIKAQPAFVGAQGKTILDPDFDIDDSGLPHEKPALPKK